MNFGKLLRFVLIWSVPLFVIPAGALAWRDHGAPPLGIALFLIGLCVLSPLLNRALWGSR